MTSRLLTGPAALAVSLDRAKENLRIDGSDMDALVTGWLAGVIAYAEHYTGRAFIHQAWRVTLDGFSGAIRIPVSPVATVTSLKYLDAAGVEQTLDPLDYYVDTVSEPGCVVPAPGTEWPDTYDRINSVVADVVCGYGAADTSTPPGIALFILAKLTEQFDPATKVEKDTVQSSFIDHLLDRYKVYG